MASVHSAGRVSLDRYNFRAGDQLNQVISVRASLGLVQITVWWCSFSSFKFLLPIFHAQRVTLVTMHGDGIV